MYAFPIPGPYPGGWNGEVFAESVNGSPVRMGTCAAASEVNSWLRKGYVESSLAVAVRNCGVFWR